MKYHRYRRATTISVHIKTFAISDTYNTHIVKVRYTQTCHKNDNDHDNNIERKKEDTDNNHDNVIIMMKIMMITIGQCIFLMSDK